MITEKRISVLENGNLEIFIPAKFKKYDGKVMIIEPEEAGEMKEAESWDLKPVSAGSLARHLARAHAWLELLESEIFQNVLQLAEELNVDPSYAGRTLRMVNLAPNIQEAIINGVQPEGLTFNKLKGNIPDDWEEQREIFDIKNGGKDGMGY
jgi:hypothetical protein